MPPKGKAGAKAAAKAAAKSGEVEKIKVPRPPPTPTLVKFPEENGTQARRCVLLAWTDPEGHYKLQCRAYTNDERDPEEGWQDNEQVQPQPLGGRKNVFLIMDLQMCRLEFRLALRSQEMLGDKYVANWFSAPSEPVAAVVDPPARPLAQVKIHGDRSNVGAVLSFGTTNPDLAAMHRSGDPEEPAAGPWSAWPGLGICRAQARWRVLRSASTRQSPEPAHELEAASPEHLAGAAVGEKQEGPLVEVGETSCPFDQDTGMWSFLVDNLPYGLILRFEIRVGTAFRWSTWSEESDDLPIVVRPPAPTASISVLSITDSQALVQWEPFQLAEELTLCEYRVSICQLPTEDKDAVDTAEQWDEESARVSGIFTAKRRSDEEYPTVQHEIKSLTADIYYAVRVDARYPFVGDRDWSTAALTHGPLHTNIALRPPPLAPVAIASYDLECVLRAGQGSAGMPEELPFDDGRPWLAMLIQYAAYETYNIEYCKSAGAVPSMPEEGEDEDVSPPAVSGTFSSATAGGGPAPASLASAADSAAPVADEVQELVAAEEAWRAASQVVALGLPSGGDKADAWIALAVLLQEDAADWRIDAVVCRLRHQLPSSVAPHLGTSSVSASLVPFVEPPMHCMASVRFEAKRQSFGIMVRFYLGSAHPEGMDGSDALGMAAALRMACGRVEAAHGQGVPVPSSTQTARHCIGHRSATRAQLRFRPAGGAEHRPWTALPPSPLPPAARHACAALGLGFPPEDVELPDIAALAWDAGDRHEVWVWAADGLHPGEEYEVCVRVGTSYRWSVWTDLPSTITFKAPAPRPLGGRPQKGDPAARITCKMSSPTAITIRFPPFSLAPGATGAEYVATATASFRAAEAKDAAADAGEDIGESCTQVTRSIVVKQQAIHTDDMEVQQLFERNALAELPNQAPLAALGQFKVLYLQEQDRSMDFFYKYAGQHPVEMELTGLLPAMRYEVVLHARYPDDAASPLSEPLTEVVETPCGAGAPLAPLAPPASIAAVAGVDPLSREVVLEYQERPGYVLQCIAVAPDAEGGWYPMKKSDDPAASVKKKDNTHHDKHHHESGLWWNSNGHSVDEWTTIPTRRARGDPMSRATDAVRVIAELPGFNTTASNAEANCALPDLLRFRLCVSTRSTSHPCRWVGSFTSPVASCIAPLVAAPLLRRVYTDHGWHVSISVFLHRSSRPKGPASVSAVRKQMGDDYEFSELMDADSGGSHRSGEPHDDDEAGAGCDVPVGFGHRGVAWLQSRVVCVGMGSQWPGGEMDREWVEMPEAPASQCKVPRPPPSVQTSLGTVGDLHTLSISGTDNRLVEGGLYRVQVRLGDGHRWSAWSPSSLPVEFAVPVPQPARGQLQLDTLSADVVQCSWPAFSVPRGLTEVSYQLHAAPASPADALQGAHSVEAVHVLPVQQVGETLQGRLQGLTPGVEYTFRVSARYPRVGQRSWSEALTCGPEALDDGVADAGAPPVPSAFSCNGPEPFAVAEDGLPFFHASERAMLLGFPDTSSAPDGVAYRLEYRHIGLVEHCLGTIRAGGRSSFRSLGYSGAAAWRTPLEVKPVLLSQQEKESLLAASAPTASTWKLPPQLWRVRLPSVSMSDEETAADLYAAHSQRLQFRLAAKDRRNCPVARWYSGPSAPLCAALAPPLRAAAALLPKDSHLSIEVKFCLDRRLLFDTLRSMVGEPRLRLFLEGGTSGDPGSAAAAPGEDAGAGASGLPAQLPQGFGHAFASRFQIRSRHSPRPPGKDPGDGKRPTGVPWSAWVEYPDTGLQATSSREVTISRDMASPRSQVRKSGQRLIEHSAELSSPGGTPLDYGSWYQVSIRISDGTAWSGWSEPSAPVKVFVAPPKPVNIDTDMLKVEKRGGGNNVRLKWPLLRAHCNLRLIEYAVFVSEALRDTSEICPRRVAALFIGNAAGVDPDGQENMSLELRDLRQDVTYLFTLATRYPHVGNREFVDALSSAATSLKPAFAPLPVPAQLPLPEERLRRVQSTRCVLVRWSFSGIPPDTLDQAHESDYEIGAGEHQYDLQALPEGGLDGDWIACRTVSKLMVDGVPAWLVKDVPGPTLRCRFRLWDRETGRFGRTSPLMLAMMEAATKVGALRVVTLAGTYVVLRVPLDSPHGSHKYICRYQVRYRAEKMHADWNELPIQMLWHRQNDHMVALDPPVDERGAVVSGLAGRDRQGNEGKWAGDGQDAIGNGVERSPCVPTLPLSTVAPCGDVAGQRCLVAKIREEDGLVLGQPYSFSVRVGDLYRMSDWSDASSTATLGVPPPQLSPALIGEDSLMHITDVSDKSLVASWPQYRPAVQAGVPAEAQVEYRLEVAPQAPKRRLAGRAAVQEELPLHSQWLLTSQLPPGVDAEKALAGNSLRLSVSDLAPNCSYELRLSVRYARLGARTWTDALSATVLTKKSDAERIARLDAGSVAAAVAPGRGAHSTTPRTPQAPSPMNVPRSGPSSVTESPRPPPAPVVESPRRLPPLERGASPSPAAPARSASAEPAANLPTQSDVEEWMVAAHGDVERLLGGGGHGAGTGGLGVPLAARSAPLLSPTAAEAEAAGLPPRPPDFKSFWQRDPADVRPMMPAMPSASHSAMQLDLVGRSTAFPVKAAAAPDAAAERRQEAEAPPGVPIVPRPPNSERLPGRAGRPGERSAYPRRVIYG